jgi:hypothetical protein
MVVIAEGIDVKMGASPVSISVVVGAFSVETLGSCECALLRSESAKLDPFDYDVDELRRSVRLHSEALRRTSGWHAQMARRDS